MRESTPSKSSARPMLVRAGFTASSPGTVSSQRGSARLGVDLIVASGSPAVEAAKDATSTIPIVMPVSGDPVGQGFVAGLAGPGGNVTGLTTMSSSELSRKRLQLLREIAPAASRVAVLWNPTNSAKVLDFRETETAAGALGMRIESLTVRGPGDFDGALGTPGGRWDGLIALVDLLTLTHRARIVEFAARGGLPAIYELREFAELSGLLVYGPSLDAMYRRAAAYADKILKGTKPADLPIELPTTFDFVINLKTAQALGLTIPQSVLVQATEIIQ